MSHMAIGVCVPVVSMLPGSFGRFWRRSVGRNGPMKFHTSSRGAK